MCMNYRSRSSPRWSICSLSTMHYYKLYWRLFIPAIDVCLWWSGHKWTVHTWHGLACVFQVDMHGVRVRHFKKFIKYRLTQQLTKLSNFIWESGEFLSLVVPLLLLATAAVASLTCSVLVFTFAGCCSAKHFPTFNKLTKKKHGLHTIYFDVII